MYECDKVVRTEKKHTEVYIYGAICKYIFFFLKVQPQAFFCFQPRVEYINGALCQYFFPKKNQAGSANRRFPAFNRGSRQKGIKPIGYISTYFRLECDQGERVVFAFTPNIFSCLLGIPRQARGRTTDMGVGSQSKFG